MKQAILPSGEPGKRVVLTEELIIALAAKNIVIREPRKDGIVPRASNNNIVVGRLTRQNSVIVVNPVAVRVTSIG